MDIEVASAPFVGGFASNHEFDATVTAGSDRVLLVAIGSGSTNDLYTAVLFNGVPMARAHRANNGGPSAYWYFLAAPAVGTFRVRIEQSAAGGCNAQAFLLKDAPQTGIIAATGPSNAGNGFASSPWSVAISGAGRVALSVLHSASGLQDFTSTTGTDVSGFGGNAAQFEVAYANNASAMAWSWTGGTTRNLVQSIIAIPGSIGPAGPELTGSVTTDDAAPTGQLQSNPPSTLTGNISTDAAAPTGSISSGAAPGTVVLISWRNKAGMPLPNQPVARVTLQRLADGVQVVNVAGLTTSASPTAPQLSITNAALVPGTLYVAVANNADGTVLGIELVQAA